MLPFQPISGHILYAATITSRNGNRVARRDLFGNSLAPPVNWKCTLPSSWLPNNPKALQKTILHVLSTIAGKLVAQGVLDMN